MRSIIVLVAVLTLLPVAAAENIFSSPTCVAGVCVTPTVCVPGVVCQPTTCSPALTCDARRSDTYECRTNTTNQGRVCERVITFSTGASNQGAGVVDANVRFENSDGGVANENLRNEWASRTVEVQASVLDFELGSVTLVLYNSTIETSNDNTAEHFGVGASYQPGQLSTGAISVVAGVILIDGELESCYARTGPVVTSADCPVGLP